MSHFVWSSSSLPGMKTDLNPVDNPSQQWAADDSNRTFQAIYDARDAFTGSLLEIPAVRFGALGNGVADDSNSIQSALNAASIVFSGSFGGFVSLPRGVYMLGSAINLPNGVGLRGAGTSATILRAKSTFSGSALISNTSQDGTQEFAFLERLQVDGNRGNGAICGSVVKFGSLFINSYIRDLLITEGSNVGLHIPCSNAMGPVYVENTWVLNNTGHNVLIEELTGNNQTAAGICFMNLTSEHQGSNKSAIYLSGSGHCAQWNFYNTHIEMGGLATGRTAITIDGVSHVLFSGVQLLTSVTSSSGIKITDRIENVGIQIRGLTNINLINPVIQDLKNGVTVGAQNVPIYVTPDVTVRGGPRFVPASGSSVSAAFQDSNGNDRMWFDNSGSLAGSSINGAAVDIVGDATNDRTLALVSKDRQRVFAWSFPDASNIRFRYLTGPADLLNFDNSGNGFVYNPMTFQALVTLQSSLKGPGTRLSAPAAGAHVQGEIVFNADPIAGGFIGWVCVTSGTPGTWKTWGVISA